MKMNSNPWGSNLEAAEEGEMINSRFDSNFCQNDDSNKKPVIDDNYSSKLEEKLQRMQKKKHTGNTRNPAKDMLSSLQTQRESHMATLMGENDPTYNSNMNTSENPSFIDNLYQTNSIYRHLNPQQALESSEKIPIVYHDELNNTVNNQVVEIEAKVKSNENKEET